MLNEAHGIRQRVDGNGVAHIVFDRPGDKVNLLDADILRALDGLLDEASRRDDIRGVVFTSGKPGMFLAGMDVSQIGAVTDAHLAAEGSRLGQAVFQKIADLGKPSACAIGGSCLGGGTELALACTFRLASGNKAVKIGLPEVQLGIIPGFGGSQRLPRLVGLTASLDMILTGRQIDARKARKIGLIDGIVPEAYLDREAAALVFQAAEKGSERVAGKLRKKRGMAASLLETLPPLRRYVLKQAEKRTSAKIDRRDYPAPFAALQAVEAALTQPLPQGLDFEARLVGELVPTETSKNLIWLFESHAALKGGDGGIKAAPRKVRKLAVLGAGIMGGGIAQLAADRGIPVRMRDLQYDAVLTALKTARRVWDYKLERKRLSQRELDQKIAFISPTLELTGFRGTDLVIEAVVEKLEVKQAVLAELEQRVGERTVFASNTSSLPISEIAAKTRHPERVVGMHFFNPVHRMPLVEVIAGSRSSPEAVATVRALAIKLGKVPVIVKDGPGFLVNRILTLYLNEAMQLLTEGVRIETIDRAMTAFGMPLGPLALLDQIGLDTAQHVARVLKEAFGDRAGGTEGVVQTLVDDGKLGEKSGAGFYKHRNGKRADPDPAIYRLIGAPAARDLPPETLQERMVLSMINEAAICLSEGVVAAARDIDIAMVMGTGFPPFRGGLLRHADRVGIPIVADRLQRLAEAQGRRFRPAELFGRMVREQQRFNDLG